MGVTMTFATTCCFLGDELQTVLVFKLRPAGIMKYWAYLCITRESIEVGWALTVTDFGESVFNVQRSDY